MSDTDGVVPARLAIVDLDGTLIDTNYHHALAWYRAFREHDCVLPIWRIHRAIGMGGDNLIEYLAGAQVERELGDGIRAAQSHVYGTLIDEVAPLAGAGELLEALKERGLDVVLASSATKEEVEHYLGLLDARDLVDAWTTSADVESTKPDPDLVLAALDKGGGAPAVMIGDTTWDVIAAEQAGVPTLCLTTGGFSADELEHAGAIAVFESIPELQSYLANAGAGFVIAP
jgi:HAD superfamily hydrolase (TIGR01509 family)